MPCRTARVPLGQGVTRLAEKRDRLVLVAESLEDVDPEIYIRVEPAAAPTHADSAEEK